ncbi:MAG: serine/threonine-protein kinase [Polyangiaceae bacterium]
MSFPATEKTPEQQVGRYAIFESIAAGGMATVHIARLMGREGFSRVVAAKRMHRHFLQDPNFKQMFLEEALLAARVRHPNVVPIVDVLSHENELIIVMDYVHGESVLALMRAVHEKGGFPPAIAASVIVATLQGLHAAHEAKNERGEPLGIVHRDVSPHNVLVGTDGVARVVDFGVAKAVHAKEETRPGILKGKFSYMAPEVVQGQAPTRQADVFSAAVVLWEMLAGRKLFAGATEQERLLSIVNGNYPSPRVFNPKVSLQLERIAMKGLTVDPKARYATALEMAIDLERQPELASQRVIGEWVATKAAGELDRRAALLHDIEASVVVPTASVGDRHSMVGLGNSVTAPSAVISALPAAPAASRRLLPLLGAAAGLIAIAVALAFNRTSPKVEAVAAAPAVAQPVAAQPVVAAPPVAEPVVAAPPVATTQPSSEPANAPSEQTLPAAPLASARSGRTTPAKPAAQTKSHGKNFLPNEL